jgi:hypothetical protein
MFPCPIECVQTDNGQEFTKRFSPYGGSDKLALFSGAPKGAWHRSQADTPFYTKT